MSFAFIRFLAICIPLSVAFNPLPAVAALPNQPAPLVSPLTTALPPKDNKVLAVVKPY